MEPLPLNLSPDEFDSGLERPGALVELLLAASRRLASHHRLAGEVEYLPGGSNFIATVGPWNVLKLFPPFHRYQWDSELQVLKTLSAHPLPASLGISVPEFRAAGEHEGWGYVAMSRLTGTQLESLLWPSLSESEQCGLLEQIGELMRAVHNLPAQKQPELDPPWELFWPHQRERCLEHQRRRALPAQLLAELPDWIEQRIPELPPLAPRVLLTGEYTPQNLLVKQVQGRWRLTGMLDFADSMIGPARYDWLGPVCFLVQGQRPRLEAFLQGYTAVPGVGSTPTEFELRIEAFNHLLLHRYSNLRFQLRIPGWTNSPSLEALSRLIWPPA